MGTVHYLRSSDRQRRPTPRRRRSKAEKSRPLRASGSATQPRGVSVIPFPMHRTAVGRAEALRTTRQARAPVDRLRPFLLILAIGSLSLGLAGVHHVAWLSYMQIVTGLLGLIEAGTKAHSSRGRRWLLGWAAQAIAIFAFVEGVRGWPVYWTLAFGVAFLMSARKPKARLGHFD